MAWPRPAGGPRINPGDAYDGRGINPEHDYDSPGTPLETLADGQRSGKSGIKTENAHISTATAEVEPLEAWTPGPNW